MGFAAQSSCWTRPQVALVSVRSSRRAKRWRTGTCVLAACSGQGYNVQLASSDGPMDQIAKIKGDNLRMFLQRQCSRWCPNLAQYQHACLAAGPASWPGGVSKVGAASSERSLVCIRLSSRCSSGPFDQLQEHLCCSTKHAATDGHAALSFLRPNSCWMKPRQPRRPRPRCTRGRRCRTLERLQACPSGSHSVIVLLVHLSGRAPDFVPMQQCVRMPNVQPNVQMNTQHLQPNVQPNPTWQDRLVVFTVF